MTDNDSRSSASTGPSAATMLSFLACAAGGMSFFVLTAGSGVPLPLLMFILFPWLGGALITFLARSSVWQLTWLVCVALLAFINIAVVGLSMMTDDLLLRLVPGALPLFNICGVTVGFGVSWLVAATMVNAGRSTAGQSTTDPAHANRSDAGTDPSTARSALTSHSASKSLATHDDATEKPESTHDPRRNESSLRH